MFGEKQLRTSQNLKTAAITRIMQCEALLHACIGRDWNSSFFQHWLLMDKFDDICLSIIHFIDQVFFKEPRCLLLMKLLKNIKTQVWSSFASKTSFRLSKSVRAFRLGAASATGTSRPWAGWAGWGTGLDFGLPLPRCRFGLSWPPSSSGSPSQGCLFRDACKTYRATQQSINIFWNLPKHSISSSATPIAVLGPTIFTHHPKMIGSRFLF